MKDKDEEEASFETMAIHAGHNPDGSEERSCAVPINQTASYLFEDVDQPQKLFVLEEEDFPN